MWTTIENFPNYEISKFGNVRNIRKKRNLKQYENSSGYLRCQLYSTPKVKFMFTHILMWESFVGEIMEGYTIIHVDKDRTNNKLDNLESVKSGTRGTRNSYTSEFKTIIQDEINLGKTSRSIGREYGITHQWVSEVRNKGKWIEVGSKK